MIYSINAMKDSQNFICYQNVASLYEAQQQIKDALSNGFSYEQIHLMIDSENELEE